MPLSVTNNITINIDDETEDTDGDSLTDGYEIHTSLTDRNNLIPTMTV